MSVRGQTVKQHISSGVAKQEKTEKDIYIEKLGSIRTLWFDHNGWLAQGTGLPRH